MPEFAGAKTLGVPVRRFFDLQRDLRCNRNAIARADDDDAVRGFEQRCGPIHFGRRIGIEPRTDVARRALERRSRQSIAVDRARRRAWQIAQEFLLLRIQNGFRVVLHGPRHLAERAGTLWVRAVADCIVVVSLYNH